MLLEKLYADFIKHTGLTDSVYKSVFSNISDVLEKVKDISWEYLKYVDQAGESIVFDFKQDTKIPQYGIDLFRNIFLNYYILPENSEVILGLTYKDIPYTIKDTAQGLVLPDQVSFLSNMGVFNIFLLDREVFDLFGAFDDEFEFIECFKNGTKDIYGPLRKKFEESTSRNEVIEGSVSENKVADTRLSVEILQNKMKELLDKIETIRKERDKLAINKNKLYAGLKSRESLELERQKLQIEFDTLNETCAGYVTKDEKVKALVMDMDVELADLHAKKEGPDIITDDLSSDIKYLSEKKAIFVQDRNSLRKSIDDFKTFISDLQSRIKNIDIELVTIDSYSTNDIEILQGKINGLNEEQDNLYGILLGLESELKQQKGMLEKSSLQVEQAHMYSDVTVQNIESSSIINHLATAQQPASVTTVVNYMRYYFVYRATVVADDLMRQDTTIDAGRSQAAACKIVLADCFNVYFNQIFSSVDLHGTRFGKVILITKE